MGRRARAFRQLSTETIASANQMQPKATAWPWVNGSS
jgi:hypothetical protein